MLRAPVAGEVDLPTFSCMVLVVHRTLGVRSVVRFVLSGAVRSGCITRDESPADTAAHVIYYELQHRCYLVCDFGSHVPSSEYHCDGTGGALRTHRSEQQYAAMEPRRSSVEQQHAP